VLEYYDIGMMVSYGHLCAWSVEVLYCNSIQRMDLFACSCNIFIIWIWHPTHVLVL